MSEPEKLIFCSGSKQKKHCPEVAESRWFSAFVLGVLMADLKKGQAALEYFIIFTIIAVLTILSFSTFLPKVKEAIQGSGGFFQNAARQITQ
jgi:Flp pilus assembly pilin Flp